MQAHNYMIDNNNMICEICLSLSIIIYKRGENLVFSPLKLSHYCSRNWMAPVSASMASTMARDSNR